jgi:hypothetical protein
VTANERIARAIEASPGNVILREELSGLAGASQVTRALNSLQVSEVLIRIGTGVYAKTRKSSVTGASIPAGGLETLALEALRRLKVPAEPGKAAAAYNVRATSQIPGSFVVNTGRRRISRRISVGGRALQYENNYR